MDKTDKESIILLLPSSYQETEILSGMASSTGKLYRVCEISAVNAGQATMERSAWPVLFFGFVFRRP